MKNILRIFRGDIRRVRANVIALIIILGLAIIPSMYAWFNIAASWDPYGNTGNLKVAVANADQGYESDLFPMELNMGEKVESSLRGNQDLNWIFTTEEDAIEGTRSGKYYAAIVITEDFSKNMLSLFSEDKTDPVIRYYCNEKENAISVKVTDKAAGTVQARIDTAFVETLSEIMISTYDGLSGYLDENQTENYLTGIKDRLRVINNNLNASAETIESFMGMTDTLQDLIATTSDMLEQTGSGTQTDQNKISDSADQVQDLSDSIDTVNQQIDQSLKNSVNAYSGVEDKIDQSFQTLSDDRADLSDNLEGLSADVQTLIDRYMEWKTDLTNLQESLPEGEIIIRQSLHQTIMKLDRVIEKQTGLKNKLDNADALLADIDADISEYQTDLESAAAECKTSLQTLQTEYDKNLKDGLAALSGTLSDAGADADKIHSLLNQTVKDSDQMLTRSSQTLTDMQTLLAESVDQLRGASDDLDQLMAKMDAAANSGDLGELEELFAQNSSLLASLWASPVKVDTHPVYEIKNNGSAMAPFYSALSIWVGGIIMVAMMKVMVSDERIKALQQFGKVRQTELYFGRLLIFLLLGLVQSTIICLGDLLFLGIQCHHPMLFLLSGWVSSIVYVTIIYTLTISFGDIGKAAAVILLVMQVAGSGGSFPIELAPAVFHKLYPLLPFVHTMDAMRECIAGMYQNVYWLELKNLLLYLIPALILGLILRRPIIRLNRFFEEKLEEVKFM